MPYAIQIKASALKALEKLPQALRVRIRDRIAALAANPRPPGAVKLSAADDFWRIRAGDWRVVYAVLDRRLIVLVVRIGHRRDVYRRPPGKRG